MRTTLAATIIVALTLSAGSVMVVTRLRTSLDDNRRSAAIARAADIASLAGSARLPAVLPLPDQVATYAQVVDRSGRVLASSANIAGRPPLGAPVAAGSRPVVERVTHSPVDGDGTLRMVSVPAGDAARPLTVFAAYSLVGDDFAIHDVDLALLIGLPLLLVVVSVTTWLLVGVALRPIEAIRSEVSEITTLGLHRRVPEPAGGDEIARLAKTMNTMLDRLEGSLETQKAFVADASHELRSPLASLRAQLEIGLAGGTLTDWEATVTDALAEEQRIERMVRDLLLLARLDQHAAVDPAVTPTVDLGDVVAADLATRPVRSGVVVRCDTTAAAPVQMASDHARRLVANLVDNAQRHAERSVTVTVGVEGSRWAELTVGDDGAGVAVEDRERIFERFTRLDAARATDDGGAGLGLAIVKDIVGRHGGTARFVDAAKGACVVVRLPLHAGSLAGVTGA